MVDISSSYGDDIDSDTRTDSYGAIGLMKMGLYRVGREGTCAYWSSGAQKILGWEAREIVGQDIHSVIHEDQTAKENCRACHLHSTASSEAGNLVRFRDRNGRIHRVETIEIPTTDAFDQHDTTVVFREIEEGTLRSNDELSRRYEITNQVYQSVMHSRDLHGLHKEICRILVDSGGFRMVWIGVTSKAQMPQVDIVASAGMTGENVRHLEFSRSERVWQGRGTFMRILQTGKLLLIQDFASDPAMALQHVEALKLGFRSYAGFPIVVQGHVVGVLNLYQSTPHFFQRDQLQLIGKVVDALSWAVKIHDKDEQHRRADTQVRLAAKAFESQEAMTITDSNANILLVNEAFTRITGYSLAEVIGQNPRILQSGRQDVEFYRHMWHALLTKGKWEGEIWNRRKDGQIYAEWLTISAVKDEQGAVINYIAHFVDLSPWKAAVTEIEFLANHDALTGLANRRKFFQVLNQVWVGEASLKTDTFLLFIDLDRFKEINDSLGHRFGDLLLQEVAKRLSQETRSGDMVARLGGDEFVLLCRSTGPEASMEEVKAFAESVRYTLTQPYVIDQHVLHVTPSIGVRVLAMEYSNTQEVVQEADLAMYQAKSSGGNCVKCYEPKMRHRFRKTYELEQDLRIAIERGEIQLYYQGQFDHQGRLVGAEVLSRWMRKGVMVPPSEFIPIAEQTELITDLGMFVLRRALQQLHNWNRRRIRLPKLSINMSVHQFRAPDFVNQMKRVMKETQVDARWIVLEITESVFIEDADEARQKLESLRAVGVEFSIDNFGTGYSSLAYLHTLPIHELKIDRQFTREIVASSSAQSIVKSIMGIGQSLSLRVVAHGVETKEEEEGIFLTGCENYQGYYFMRPEPKGEFEQRL